ncbi:MAG: hypothetical protein EOO28_19880 [Comamonadaceae bacterium]|nr:MAG: hypothetical protein EOO28_19880 [Comamonadaceae bacterium]
MNKHLHRIIFNKSRGERMVVQETASGAGKAAGGETGSHPRSGTWFGPVLAALGVLATVQPLAHAQIIADPSAPASQRAVVLNTASGLPQVNIQTPSAAGVSRNT